MIYKHRINGTESKAFSLIIGGMACPGILHPGLERPISDICIGTCITTYEYVWMKFAGNNQHDFYKPYLAGEADIIAFDKTVQTMVKYDVGYCDKTDGTRTLMIEPQLGCSVATIYPLIATLMQSANDIDVSDENFRAWLINNRPIAKPKVNKMAMTEDGMKNELFKFLQLREHADKVKITQEQGQQLFKLLVDRAEAIAHEEVSGDALATDSDKFLLELINNIINAPKPKPFAIQSMDLDERMQFLRLSFEYEQRCRLPMLSGQINLVWFGHSVQQLQTVMRKVFGEPVKTDTDVIYFLFKVNDIACRVMLDGYSLIVDVHRESGRRDEIVRAIRAAIEDAYKKEQGNNEEKD